MNKKLNIIILGGTSDVALKLGEILSKEGHKVNASFRKDHPILPEINWFELDVNQPNQDLITDFTKSTDVVFCFTGYCPIPQETYTSGEEIDKITSINYSSLIPIIEPFVHAFEQKGAGTIVGVSSVAGDRGRASNYLYGSAKAGFTAYLSGIRNRLAKHGAHVMTVLPGFMDTKMTAGLETPNPLTVSSEEAAQLIYKGFKKKKNILYVSGKWQIIMLIIKSIPEFIFKKLSL